jgi:hypothetical protein
MPATIRLHLVFHASNLRPYVTSFPRPDVLVTTLEGDDDDEFRVSHISAFRIETIHGRRGKIFALYDALQ